MTTPRRIGLIGLGEVGQVSRTTYTGPEAWTSALGTASLRSSGSEPGERRSAAFLKAANSMAGAVAVAPLSSPPSPRANVEPRGRSREALTPALLSDVNSVSPEPGRSRASDRSPGGLYRGAVMSPIAPQRIASRVAGWPACQGLLPLAQSLVSPAPRCIPDTIGARLLPSCAQRHGQGDGGALPSRADGPSSWRGGRVSHRQ